MSYYNYELMGIRYKGIWYNGLAVISYFLMPYTTFPFKLKMLILWTNSEKFKVKSLKFKV